MAKTADKQNPLFGNMTPQQLKDNLLRSMKDEASAAEFYTRLMNEAPDELHKMFIMDARDDELKHLQRFENLYVYYFGTKPQFDVEYIEYPDYKEGILMALKSELQAATFYRDVQLSTKDPLVRDTFYYPMIDEIEHANQFGILYNRL
jgi:rubrerythrin